MQRDPSRNGVKLPLVAPLATVEPEKRAFVPDVPDVGVTDPYEVAYLRGGDREVLRLHLFDLVQRGYLEIVETRKWLSTERQLAISPNAPPKEALTGTQRTILGWFATPLTAKEILTLHTREPVAAACERLRAKLEANGQLASPQEVQKAVRVGGVVAAVVLVLAGWELVGFVTAIAANVAALTFFRRLSRSGRERLNDLEATFSHLKDRPRSARLDVADPAAVMAVAVFGTAILADSVYDAFAAAAGPDPSWSFSVGLDGGCDADGGCGGCGGCD